MDPTANQGVSAFSGLKYFRALMEGSIARSAMLELFDINIEAAEPGLVVLTAIPTAEHYNPLGFVHGGYAAVLLDTCMAAAIVTSLEPGLSSVTLEYKINFARPMSAETGVVRGEGKTLHVGRQMAIGEGRLLDAKGIRVALRREMLLALMRLWDNDPRAVAMERIGETLRDKQVADRLAVERAARIGLPESEDQMKIELGQRAATVVELVDKYSRGGSHHLVREKLQALRNERLAHRQTTSAADPADAADSEIEDFYQDNSKLVSLLLSLVEAMAYDPSETAEVYRYHAAHFWTGVRGENTAGHPNYRGPNAAENK